MSRAIGRVLRRLEGLRSSQPNVQITYRDTGASRVAEQLEQLGQLSLTIGYQGATALTLYDRGNVNVATVALYQEFGTQTIPARPFMRRSVRENLNELQQEIGEAFASVARLEQTAIAAMDSIGRFMAEKMAEAIDTAPTWAVPLVLSAVAKKGHADPLFETGLMRESISWAVRTGGPMGSVIREGSL